MKPLRFLTALLFLCSTLLASAALNGVGYTNLGGVVNVYDFGAKGKGGVDDTSAIQAGLNAASTNHAGWQSAVFLPSGTYYVSSTLIVPPYVLVYGLSSPESGSGTILIVRNVSGASMVLSPYSAVRGIDFYKSPSTAFSANSIGVAAGTYTDVEDCSFYGLGTGILVTNSWQSYLRSVYAQDCGTGILLSNIEFVTVEKGLLGHNTNGLVVIGSYASGNYKGVSVRNCSFVQESANGILATNVHALNLEKNFFFQNQVADVVMTNCRPVSLTGNIFVQGYSELYLQAQSCTNVTFVGNEFQASAAGTVLLDATSENTVWINNHLNAANQRSDLSIGWTRVDGGWLTVNSNIYAAWNVTATNHFVGVGPTPTIVTNQPGAGGTGATATLSATASDTAGLVSLHIGTVNGGGQTVATVTFAHPYDATPVVLLSHSDTGAGSDTLCTWQALTVNANGFGIGAGTLTANDNYKVGYHVIGK